MKLLAFLLLATVSAATQDEPCQTPIAEYQPSVESMLKLPEGLSISWVDKYVSRLGDDAAVILIRLGAPKNLQSPSDIRKALNVLHVAFDCPSCIEHNESKTAEVTALLLDLMESRTRDPRIIEQIAKVRDYIGSQLKEYRDGAMLLKETPVVIRSASMRGDMILLNVEMYGKPMQLECFRSQADCKIPKPGTYSAVRNYRNFQELELYEQSSDSQTAKLFGYYYMVPVF
jgi:hypothetical protein